MPKEIRLDYLQNPPLNRNFSSLFMPSYNFSSIASKERNNQMEGFRNKLKNKFDKLNALPFNFSSGGFVELFSKFSKIYYTTSLHYEIRVALDSISKFVETIKIPLQSLENGMLEADIGIRSDLLKDDILMIVPLINEDIFSINKIPEIRNATLALDISYAVALGLEIDNSLADIFLINSTPLGLLEHKGVILSNKPYTSMIYKNGVSEAFYHVIESRILERKSMQNNVNLMLFDKLKSMLGKDIALFVNDFAPNTLPLRFKHINTRHLIEHLYLDNIYIQSSQDCYLGFIKPSYTLTSLGFGMLTSRELCAITFNLLEDLDFIASKLAQSYQMIRLMEL